MSILKIKNSNNHWVNIPSIKGDKGDKGDPGEVSQADLDEAVNDLKADLEQFPYGNYSEMTVGSAEQLLSTQYTEDKEPYLLRASGGSVEVGTREEDVIVGGTVCWNQLALFTSLPSARDGMTFSTDDNKSITINGTVNASSGSSTSGYFNLSEIGAFTDATKDHVFVFTTALISGSMTGSFVFTISTYLSPLKAQISVGTSTMLKNTAASSPRRINTNATSESVFTDYKITINLFDLTQMFGTTIANAVYAMEQATAGAGVAWFRKYFPRDYYAYDAGTLKSVEGLVSHDTVGFNQWDEEWERGGYDTNTGGTVPSSTTLRGKNKIRVLSGATYYVKAPGTMRVFYYDANFTYLRTVLASANATLVIPSDASYLAFHYTATLYNHDVCINLSDPTKNGTYEPYEKHSYPLDSSLTLRGIPKLDANNKMYYDGDKYLPNGTVERRYGVVDLGTLSWSMGNNNIFFVTNIARANGFFNLMCSKYVTSSVTTSINDIEDKAVRGAGTTGYVYIRDTNYNNAADFKTAMSGIMLVYELATPTIETAQQYKTPQIVDKYGTEEYVIDSNVTVPVPVGHETKYLTDLRGELETLIATKDKTVTVSGSTPTVTAEENTRYICGEVTSLSFTPCASGICDVRFTSGSTVTVLTLPSTVKFPDWFDPTSLEANTVYEINILDGVYGVVMSWAV